MNKKTSSKMTKTKWVGTIVIMTRNDATTCKKQHKKKEKQKGKHKQEEWTCKSQNKHAMNSKNTKDKKQGKGLDKQGPLIFMVKCKVHTILKY